MVDLEPELKKGSRSADDNQVCVLNRSHVAVEAGGRVSRVPDAAEVDVSGRLQSVLEQRKGRGRVEPRLERV